MKFLTTFVLLIVFILIKSDEIEDEKLGVEDYDNINDEDAGIIPFTHFCNFDLPMMNHSTSNDEDFCDCDIVSSPVIGKPIVKINCEMSNHVTNLTNKVFQAQVLPVNTESLILSYQHFQEVPDFVGDQLKQLDMSNNKITVIKNENFIHIIFLEHLDLSFNLITEIKMNAFEQLHRLKYLDLSSNQITILPIGVFLPLTTLETLKMSSNEKLGKIIKRGSFNGTLTSIFDYFGTTPNLKNLVMTHCELTALNLRQGVDLKRINLSFNNITDFSSLELPEDVESLELSGNPVTKFTHKSLRPLPLLRELILEDLLELTEVSDFALYGFPKLHHLTFEGSGRLSEIKPMSFHSNATDGEIDVQLKILNLRGCSIKGFDVVLEPIFSQLDEFYLDGNSFNCNCKLKWMKNLKIETNVQCQKPEALRGKLLNEIPDNRLKCDNFFMKKLINTMILLFLLAACSLAIWFFLRRLNPTRRNKLQKVGPESPYQRVTIEPNRAEYSLY